MNTDEEESKELKWVLEVVGQGKKKAEDDKKPEVK